MKTQVHQPKSLAARAAVLDSLRRGVSVSEAAAAAGVSRRTVYTWAESDPEFANLKTAAQKNSGRVIAEGQVEDWKKEQSELEVKAAQLEADLLECAGPAHAGDPDAQAKRDELREQLQENREQREALGTAIQSAEAHLKRACAEESEAARKAAQAEADELREQQRQAAEAVDQALAQIEQSWSDFVKIASQRQSAIRRAGGTARSTFRSLLTVAAFHQAPTAATALGLDRMLRTRRGRPLKDCV